MEKKMFFAPDVPGKKPIDHINRAAMNELAEKLTEYIHDNRVEGSQQTFNYGDLAIRLNASKESIQKILMPYGGGSNGITL